VTSIQARQWDAKHGLASVVLCGERNVAQRGGGFRPWHRHSRGKPCGGWSILLHVAVVVGANKAPCGAIWGKGV
jgi:hypothetical protein